jgi:hypothetical protein
MADSLRRFGEPAKQELLRRATGAHPGWRNIAGAILMYWRDWSPSCRFRPIADSHSDALRTAFR